MVSIQKTWFLENCIYLLLLKFSYKVRYKTEYATNLSTHQSYWCKVVGRISLHLTGKHFPPFHKLHKHLNRNNVRLSCSCILRIKLILNKHDKDGLDAPANVKERTFSCIKKIKHLLQEKNLINKILYKSTLTL